MPNTEFQANCVFVLKERKTSGSMFSAILAEEPEYFPIFFVQSKISTSTVRGDGSLTSEDVTVRN